MGSVVSMDKKTGGFNTGGRWAPLTNVMLCSQALERALNRPSNLPGFVVHYGVSGLGKSMAASYCANGHQGIYVECRSYFTRKAFAEAILNEMGILPERTVAAMMAQICDQLDKSRRPLIIDEADHLVDRRLIELLRDIHEGAHTTILLIGEERFPGKLKRASERFYNRVLKWQPAEAATFEDARALARYYARDINIKDDLLEHIRTVSGGIARYLCVNIDTVRDYCEQEGLKGIDLHGWGKRELYAGESPRRVSEPRRPA